MGRYTVAIVDDHLLIAKAISAIIERFADFEVLYEVENGVSLLARFEIRNNVPDILLLDISMPEMNGFETAAIVKERYPQVMILALSMQDDDESLVKMIKAGAKGYLHKNVHPTELEQALKSVANNGMYYPEWATSKIFNRLSKTEPTSSLINISQRETEFLSYVCTELTYKEIGAKMFCSPRTVESYRNSLFEKLQVKTRVALAMYAVKSGIFHI